MSFLDPQRKSILGDAMIASAIIAALVGTVFGYYGPELISKISAPSAQPDTDIRILSEESDQVASVVEKVSPAIVSIVATQNLPNAGQGRGSFRDLCSDPFFRQFFDGCADDSSPSSQKREVGAGTGFIVRSDGLLLTNRHVVDLEDAEYTAIDSSGKRYSAQVLARDPLQDLAILKLEGSNFPTIPLGNSDEVKAGQTVLAIGNALGQFSNSVSKGIISGVGRSVIAGTGDSSERLEKVFQTDAAINPGNSGGPLINLKGEVIGVNTAIASDAQNVGFAIPVNRVKKDIDDVATSGRIIYPYLGVRYVIITAALQNEYNVSREYGALVIRGSRASEVAVTPGSPAAKVGLQEHDLILELGGKRISEDYSLAEAIQAHKVGDPVALKILRDGKERLLNVVLEEKK